MMSTSSTHRRRRCAPFTRLVVRSCATSRSGRGEPFREDAATLPDAAIDESVDGFEEERWVDVGRVPVRNLVVQRFAVASERGCDGVEPDNVDGYAKTPGSPPSPLMTSWTSTVEIICREDQHGPTATGLKGGDRRV